MMESMLGLARGIGDLVAKDLSRAPFQWALGLSVVGWLAGILAFRSNAAATSTTKQRARVRQGLYWLSLLPSIAWYVMPFLPQARFASLLQGVSDREPFPLALGAIAAAIALWNGIAALRVVAENGEATGPGMADFLQPSRLLDTGAYAKVRHPMFLRDFLAHAGLAVAAGAVTATILLPVYFLMSASFNMAEECWVLRPRFGDAFEAYRAKVNGYMTGTAALTLLVLAAATTLSLAAA